jgi:ribosomal protein S18 acetylase RimI-like enzyme
MIHFDKAAIDQSEAICKLYADCKIDMIKRDILQWGDWGNNYPDKSFVDCSILKNELHLLNDNDAMIGAVVLNEEQSEEWRTMPWSDVNGKALVIHALVIDPVFQNKGYGKKLLTYCEKHAKGHRYASIRLDAFTKNDASNRLYGGFGYKIRGVVRFDSKPEGSKEYYCYEKAF